MQGVFILSKKTHPPTSIGYLGVHRSKPTHRGVPLFEPCHDYGIILGPMHVVGDKRNLKVLGPTYIAVPKTNVSISIGLGLKAGALI